MLQLARENTDDDIKNYKLGKQIIGLTCKVCRHRWAGRLEDLSDAPECPRCKH